MDTPRPPLPPFTTIEAATRKVRLAEDAWNTRDPERVSLGYTPDSYWRNRSEFIQGREQIQAFLARKWNRTMIAGTGSDPMAMRIGNSTPMA